MGSYMSKTMGKVMDENMKKQQEFMVNNQTVMLGRQIVLQNEMRQRMMAQQLSMARERFYWWVGFFSVATVALTAGAIKTKNPAVFGPMIPLSFMFGYQADLALGNKMERIIADADNIIANEPQMLRLPGNKVTVDFLESERVK